MSVLLSLALSCCCRCCCFYKRRVGAILGAIGERQGPCTRSDSRTANVLAAAGAAKTSGYEASSALRFLRPVCLSLCLSVCPSVRMRVRLLLSASTTFESHTALFPPFLCPFLNLSSQDRPLEAFLFSATHSLFLIPLVNEYSSFLNV
jgi:hypothetical protein